MPTRYHIFRLTADIGPADVFRSLRRACGSGDSEDADPPFDFDWIKRRVALRADDEAGLRALRSSFEGAMTSQGAPDDALLAGPIQQDDEGYVQPYGVTIQDPATFGELIGRSLTEIGVRGVKVVDSADCCDVMVRDSPVSRGSGYERFILEFPLPDYMRVVDLGVRTWPDQTAPQDPASVKPKRARRRKR